MSRTVQAVQGPISQWIGSKVGTGVGACVGAAVVSGCVGGGVGAWVVRRWAGTESVGLIRSEFGQHSVRNHQNSVRILSEFIRNPEM